MSCQAHSWSEWGMLFNFSSLLNFSLNLVVVQDVSIGMAGKHVKHTVLHLTVACP